MPDTADATTTIDAVRAFNRFYTRQIGLLDRSHLDSGLSLAEARILYEIHDGKGNARLIAQELALDEGYLSRILARFAKQGLIERKPAKSDRRRSDLSLTKQGRLQMAELINRSRSAVAAQLAAVEPADRRRLVESMHSIRGCLSKQTPPENTAELVQLRDLQIGDLGLIAARHGLLYAEEHGFDDSFELQVAEILLAYRRNQRPDCERAWIAVRDGQILGSIFCMRQSDKVAKLRLFYLEPEARRLGLGKRMLAACIDFARAAGYRQMRLGTHESHRAACSLYMSAGFSMVRQTPVHNYGQDLVEQAWQIDLSQK